MRHLTLLATVLFAMPTAAFAADCASLKSATLADTTITSAVDVPARQIPMNATGATLQVPALCVVKGVLHPTADSVIRFEVWMPKEGWNGRILDVGNGGFAGSIGYQQMTANVAAGYATAGSDAGHQADAEDASWAYKHPEKIKDFGWRAVHLTSLTSKAMVQAFYAKPQNKAYFDACSDGGREALMEAQRFPEDYDGILAGAPAQNWGHMLAGGLALVQASSDPEAFFSAMKLPAINAASLAACDANDGVKDGVISDPAHCSFDPAVLTCKGPEDITCLTPKQVGLLKLLYAGPKNERGAPVGPGYTPGDEANWKAWIIGNAPAGASGTNYMNGFFRYMVYTDPKWNPLAATVDDALAKAMAGPAKEIDATSPDLSRFAARGGKLLMYHGWNDPAISPQNSIRYVSSVRESLGAGKANSMLQLYLAPGMEHCLGGPGPSYFGQLGLPAAGGKGTGALDLLETWVEGGKAPGAILAAAPAASPNAAPTVRPLCPYPGRAVYDGKGDPKQPGSFACKVD